MQKTKIQWTDHSWSPWWGCTKIATGCTHCYAADIAYRFRGLEYKKGVPRQLTKDWDKPLRWDRAAAKAGVRRKVFPSMCDVFDEEVPPQWRKRFLDLVANTENLDWLVLTKRPANLCPMLEEASSTPFLVHDSNAGPRHERWTTFKEIGVGFNRLWPNLWLGCSASTQRDLEAGVGGLLATPAAVRFLSLEPLLEKIDMTRVRTGHWAYGHADITSGYLCGAEPDELYDYEADPSGFTRKPAGQWKRGECGIDWVIVGGESGPHARPCPVEAVRSVVRQCQAAGVPVFVKQLGSNPTWTYWHGSPLVPIEQPYCATSHQQRSGVQTKARLRDPKGGDIEEFPADLRVRQFPGEEVRREPDRR